MALGRIAATAATAVAGSVSIVAGLAPGAPAHAAIGPAVGFSTPVFVDTVRHGGEPVILHSTRFGTLVYSAHEGTTHLDRLGAASQSTVQFACPDPTTVRCYGNRVWIWTSEDDGRTWQLRDEGPQYTGFSDPDLTEDAGGSIYDTGIDLANDAVFSSQDGGRTWPHGTAQCHEGDRPWLAGGVDGELFMTTDDEAGSGTGHTLFHSSNHGDSCDSTGVIDYGDWGDGGSYSGFGKGLYDRSDGSFIEPAQFTDKDGAIVGVGISRLPKAADAFKGGGETFEPVEVAATPGVFSPFGAPEILTMDSAENLYFAWDTDERDVSGKGGCSTVVPNASGGSTGGPTPLPNRIMLEIGRHVGPGRWQWDHPISLAHQGNARVLWPWSAAGSAGNVSVVWYQMDRMVDPDCDGVDGQQVPEVNTHIYEAHVTGALDPSTRQITVTNASGRSIHQGGICDSGTTCVATGQDRRLGDYFSNTLDGRGCVVIASGDTTMLDSASGGERLTSLPIFIRQTSGPSLTGQDCGSTAAATTTQSSPSPSPGGGVQSISTKPAAIPNTSPAPPRGARIAMVGVGAALLVTAQRRARRRRAQGRAAA